MKTLSFLFLLWLTISCNEKRPHAALPGPIDPVEATPDSVMIIKFAKDSTATTASGHLGKPPAHVVVYVDVKQGKTLKASIEPANKANIRINQFIAPNGDADGPFGLEITKPLMQPGTYKLIIGHNLMAEGDGDVDFNISVIVE